jgi:hypothetical protein
MPKLVFPVAPDGLLVDVLVGLDDGTTVAQLAAGQPLTAPGGPQPATDMVNEDTDTA